MNELQIRLSADIKQFQAAMSTVETKLQRAEGILKKASVSADKYRGSLATLAGQLKRGEISQEEYNKGSTKLSNGLLKQQDIINNSTREVSRLSNEYKKLNTGSLVKSQNDLATSSDNLTGSLSGTNSVSSSLSRTLSDLPGGITPLFENIRQLTGNFSNLTKTAGGVGPAIAQTLKSFVTPANVALLAVSALTAAFTAYQMGAFDFMKGNEEAKKSVKDLADEINNAASKTAVESANISALRSVIEDETLSREKRLNAVQRLQDKYPEIFRNADKEKLLNGQLIGSYDLLTKAIIQRAEASLAEEQIPQLNKEKQAVDSRISLLKEQLRIENELLNTRSKFVGQGDIFSEFDLAQARIKDTEKEIKNLGTTSAGLKINIDGFTQSIVDYQGEFVNLLEPLNSNIDDSSQKIEDLAAKWEKFLSTAGGSLDLSVSDDDIIKQLEKNLAVAEGKTIEVKVKEIDIPINFVPEGVDIPDGLIEELQNKIASLTAARNAATDPSRITAYNEQLKELQGQLSAFTGNVKEQGKELKSETELIAQAFSGMSFQISEALGISNRNLRAFVGTLISNAPKIIKAISAQAKAAKAAAALTNKANLAEASGNVIVSATSAAKGLGPVGLALLPVLIAGGLALISGAFGKSAGGGGGAVATGSPQSFGNASIPQPTRQSLSDQSSRARPSTGSGRLEAVVTGDQIRFVLDQSGRRSGRG